jgi:hypothetical protein
VPVIDFLDIIFSSSHSEIDGMRLTAQTIGRKATMIKRCKMEKWQLAGIFSAEPRTKLDLSHIGYLRKALRNDRLDQTTFSASVWLKATCRKFAQSITLF